MKTRSKKVPTAKKTAKSPYLPSKMGNVKFRGSTKYNLERKEIENHGSKKVDLRKRRVRASRIHERGALSKSCLANLDLNSGNRFVNVKKIDKKQM